MAEQYGVVCRLQLKNRKLQKNKKKFQMLVFFFVLFWWLVLSPFLFVVCVMWGTPYYAEEHGVWGQMFVGLNPGSATTYGCDHE